MKRFQILLVFLLTGCVALQKDIALHPDVDHSESLIGGGRAVALEVEDVRPREDLGFQEAWGERGRLNLLTDLQGQTRAAMKGALMDRDYIVTDVSEAPQRAMYLRINRFSLEQSLAFLFTQTVVTMEVAVTVQNGHERFQRQYRVKETYDKQILESGVEGVQANRVYSRLINEIIRDPRLYLALNHDAES